MPCVLECGNLRLAFFAIGRFEKDVVGRGRVERRVEIDQINRFVPNMLPKHVQVVPEVERSRHALLSFLTRCAECTPFL